MVFAVPLESAHFADEAAERAVQGRDVGHLVKTQRRHGIAPMGRTDGLRRRLAQGTIIEEREGLAGGKNGSE